ncbi:MAG: undecaprenyl-diphosphate phosphatase [Parcubacteria group bacterium]
MSILESVVLGAVQGLTEFLPVSSSGHLVLLQKVFGVSEGALAFDIALHVATLVAVIAVFWREIWLMIRRPLSKLTRLVVLATIPAVVVGFAFHNFFEYAFSSGKFLGPCFILTGIVLFLADRNKEQIHYGKDLDSMSYMDAIFVGLAQAAAIIPALSRSGSTISVGLFRGFKKEFAIKFSFLMSVPAIIGSALFDVKNLTGETFQIVGVWPLVLGMLVAGVTGYFAIRFMLDFFSRASMKVFSFYVFLLGALVLLDQFIFKIVFN